MEFRVLSAIVVVALLIMFVWLDLKESTRTENMYTSGAYLRSKSENTEIWRDTRNDARFKKDIRFSM